MSLPKKQQESQNKKMTAKRIAALAGVLGIIALYIGAFIVANLDLGDSGRLFAGYLGALMGLPILLWLLIWSLQLLKKRREENLPQNTTSKIEPNADSETEQNVDDRNQTER